MPLIYRRFKHKETGQVCCIPAGRYGSFLNAIKKLVSYVRYNIPKYYIVHVVLTLEKASSEIHFSNLHRTLQFVATRLKRASSDFKYVAVKQIQEERLAKYGEEAVHYHILGVYSKPYVFPHAEEIAKSWRLGNVKITAPKVRMKVWKIVNYIGRYIGRGYEYEVLNFKKSFTASQIKQIYKLSAKRLAEVMAEFGKERAEGFKCTYRKVYKYTYIKKLVYTVKDFFLDVVEKRECSKKELIKEFPSEWDYEGYVIEHLKRGF